MPLKPESRRSLTEKLCCQDAEALMAHHPRADAVRGAGLDWAALIKSVIQAIIPFLLKQAAAEAGINARTLKGEQKEQIRLAVARRFEAHHQGLADALADLHAAPGPPT